MGIRELLSTRDKREARDRDDGTSVEREREEKGEKGESLLNPVSKICENARKCESRPDSENGGIFRR